jgi:dolichyl-diphosphooligosaccharide--protein glycosyltransferase
MKSIQGGFGAIGRRLSSLRPKIDRRVLLEVVVLVMVVVIAVLFRVIKLRWGPYMDAFDPLFQYRVTEYVVENGYRAWFTWHDTMSWYPMGRDIAHSSYPGIPFSATFVYQLVTAMGFKVTVYDVCLYFPVLMGAITCIVIYFLAKDLGGSSAGLFAAFFMAISEAFLARTSFGFFDTENIGIFGMALTTLWFFRSTEAEKPLTRRIVYAMGAGLSLGYIFASWGAARYVVGLLTLFILASLIINIYESRHLVSYGVTMGVGFLIAALVPKLGIKYLRSVENMTVFLLVALLVVYELASQRMGKQKAYMLIGGVILVLIVGVLGLQQVGIIKPLTGKFLRVLNPRLATESPLYASVAEHHRAVWTDFYGKFGLTFALGMFGCYFALKNLSDRNLFSVAYFATAVYFAAGMSRLSLILSAPASVMAAYGLKELVKPFIGLSSRREEGRGRRRRPLFGVSREMAIVFSVFLFFAVLPTVWGAAESSLRPTSLASSGVSAMLGGSYPQDWLQALSWMRDNTPEDAIVVSWWDYGYWIEAMANRTTLADGATKNTKQIQKLGRIMMLNQSGSLPLLEEYGADYIVVFYTFNPNTQAEWPFGDNVKWSWMVQIPELNITDYIDETGQPTETFEESTLNRLMTLRPASAFKLVFASQYNFVLVYKIDYEAVQT